jgi:hypothetical protein
LRIIALRRHFLIEGEYADAAFEKCSVLQKEIPGDYPSPNEIPKKDQMKKLIHHVLMIKNAVLILFLSGFFYDTSLAIVTLTPRISIGNTYTDNVDLTPDDEDYDYITTVSPGFDINVTEPLNTFSLAYTPTYASYLQFPEDNTLRHNASLSSLMQVAKNTQIEFSNDYLYTEDPIDREEDLTPDIDTTVRQGREPYHENTSTLGVINQFGPEDSIALEYEYYFQNNDDPTIEDRDYHRPGTTLNYWLVPNIYGTESEISYTQNNFNISDEYNDISGRFRLIRRFNPHFETYAEYTHGLTDYDVADEGDYQVYSPLIGFTWNEYTTSSFNCNFGYFFLDNEHTDDDSGPVGTIETHYTFPHGTDVSLLGTAGYEQSSYDDAENLGFNQFYRVTGRVEYPLTTLLNTYLSFSYWWNNYTNDDPDRDDTLLNPEIGLTYQALPWMMMQVNYAYRELDSNIDENDYVENRAEIFVTFSPLQPVILSR